MFSELWNHLSDYSEVLRKIRAFASCFSYIYIWICVDVFIFLSVACYLLPDAYKVLACKLFKLPNIIVTTTIIKQTITTTIIIINNCSNSSINKEIVYLNILTWAYLICKFSFGSLDFVSWKKIVFCIVSVTAYTGKQAVTHIFEFIMLLCINFFVVLSWVKF